MIILITKTVVFNNSYAFSKILCIMNEKKFIKGKTYSYCIASFKNKNIFSTYCFKLDGSANNLILNTSSCNRI